MSYVFSISGWRETILLDSLLFVVVRLDYFSHFYFCVFDLIFIICMIWLDGDTLLWRIRSTIFLFGDHVLLVVLLIFIRSLWVHHGIYFTIFSPSSVVFSVIYDVTSINPSSGWYVIKPVSLIVNDTRLIFLDER